VDLIPVKLAKINSLGNVFPWLVQVSLAIAIEIAFMQYLFMRLRKKPVSVACLDAAYNASSSLIFLFSKEMLWRLPDVSIIALVIG
jgi:hypothetical protein